MTEEAYQVVQVDDAGRVWTEYDEAPAVLGRVFLDGADAHAAVSKMCDRTFQVRPVELVRGVS